MVARRAPNSTPMEVEMPSPPDNKVCAFPSCSLPVRAKSLCAGHWRQQHGGKKLTPFRVPARTCGFAGCEHPPAARGFCQGHYLQRKRGDVLHALRPWRAPNEYGTADGVTFLLARRHGSAGELVRVLLSPEDVPRARRYRWSVDTHGYVVANAREGVGALPISLHRFLLDAVKGEEVDHFNGDPLDNRRTNLRHATRKLNAENVVQPSKLGFRNVERTRSGAFFVRVRKNGKRYSGGTFKNLDDALVAARELRAKLFTFHNEARRGKQRTTA